METDDLMSTDTATPPAVHSRDKPASSALARGLQLLQAFTPMHPELSGRELMNRTGLPKPTLFRLLATLCDAGLLRHDNLRGRFMPAPGMARLAAPLLACVRIRQLAFGPMQALAEQLQAQVSLALGCGLDLVFIELAQSRDCFTVRPAMGSHISLSRTASGRAYLASIAAPLAAQHLQAVAQQAPEQAQWLAERLAQARQDLAAHGFCLNRGDLQRQLESVAVPIRSDQPDETYVFSCTLATHALRPGQLLDDIGPRLLTLAQCVEAALGDLAPAEQGLV